MKRSNHFATMITRILSFRQLSVFGFLSLAVLLAGCLSRPTMKIQTFAFCSPLSVPTNDVPGGLVLGIRKLQIAPPFEGRSVVYRTGDFSYERDPYAEFLGPPAEQLVPCISGILKGEGCFRAIVGTGTATKPDVLVEINVSELYGDVRKPGAPCAVLALQVTFMDATNGLAGKVVFQRNYSRRIPVKSANANAFMEGWNEALTQIFAEVASDFRSWGKR
jgi:cholesterol transport system auxiliary component